MPDLGRANPFATPGPPVRSGAMSRPGNPSRPTLTLIATGLGLFMIFVDATIVNVALPDIQREFRVGEAGLQWVVAAYSLTMAMFMMSGAKLADVAGRRRTYVLGIVLFCAASVGCGLSPSIEVLDVFRGLQGIGAAIVNVSSLALVGAAFPDPSAKARAIGTWTGIAAVGLAVGPTLGGVLTESFGWESIFLVNVVFGAIAVALTLAFVTESSDPAKRGLDLPGQFLFIIGIGALTYGLIEGPHDGWASPTVLVCLLGGLATVVAFVIIELRTSEPMMDVRFFADRTYSTAIFTIFAVLFAIYGTLLIITQYFQNVRGYSPEEAGFLLVAMTLPTVICAPIAGRVTARLGPRRPTLLGVSLIATGMALLALTTGGWLGFTLIGLALVGAAGGFAVAPATNEGMSAIPPDRSGMASGMLSVQRALGSTAGFAIMGSILAAVVAGSLPGRFEPYVPSRSERDTVVERVVDAANPRAVPSVIGPAKPLPVEVARRDELVAAADDVFVEGIRAAMAAGFVVALLALLAVWRFFPRAARRTDISPGA